MPRSKDSYIANKTNRDKGFRAERRLKEMLHRWGFDCKGTRLSGQIKDHDTADLKLTIDDRVLRIEVKLRNGAALDRLYKTTTGRDVDLMDFCVGLRQESMQSLLVRKKRPFLIPLLADRPIIDTSNRTITEKLDYPLLREFFSQDDADVVAVVRKYQKFLFFIKPDIYEFLVNRCPEEKPITNDYNPVVRFLELAKQEGFI